MTAEELQALRGKYGDLVARLRADKKNQDTITRLLKQLDVAKHDINDTALRPDKVYKNEQNETTTSPVARLGLPLQKLIVRRSAAFLCGRPIELDATPTDDTQKRLLTALRLTWEDNKLDYRSKTLAKLMMGETEAAELWYTEPITDEADKEYWKDVLSAGAAFKLRMRVLANSLGDKLYPVFSPTGDMIAFGREYELAAGDVMEKHFDLYTADTITLAVEQNGAWTEDSKPNPYKKIPVIYYSQPAAEWADVQSLIDRYEKNISNHADVNDYFGSPMLVVQGKILSFAKKGESGKVMEVEPGANIQYATWDQSPESVKLEMENLLKQIYACTDTPNVSFEEMKSLGTFSGIALKLLFMAAHMKAADKEEIFGEAIQRRVNYIKAVLGVIDTSLGGVRLAIKPRFTYFMPQNDQELIDMLTAAVTGKVLSKQTAVTKNPLVEDAETELAQLKTEAEAPDNLDDAFK